MLGDIDVGWGVKEIF